MRLEERVQATHWQGGDRAERSPASGRLTRYPRPAHERANHKHRQRDPPRPGMRPMKLSLVSRPTALTTPIAAASRRRQPDAGKRAPSRRNSAADTANSIASGFTPPEMKPQQTGDSATASPPTVQAQGAPGGASRRNR